MGEFFYYPEAGLKRDLIVGKWSAALNGDLEYDNGRYFIKGSCLTEEDWLIHLFKKNWIDWNEFLPCYFQALKNRDIQFVKTRVFY